MLSNTKITRMSSVDKIGMAIQLSQPHLPAEAKAVVQSLLKPETLAIIGGTMAVWAGSHFFGVGEVVDIILLGVGFVSLGFVVFGGAGEFYDFVQLATNARTDADLEQTGRHFARAVILLGISTIQALLLRGQARIVTARPGWTIYPRAEIGAPPVAGGQLKLSRPATLPDGKLGETSAYGAITVARNQSLIGQRLSLYHELVHRFLSPRVGPFLRLRAEIGLSAYSRSVLLQYLEEALAEGFSQLRVHGFAQAFEALRFPLQAGYMTVSQIVAEGCAIGTITLGGLLFHVYISLGTIPHHD